MQQQTHSRSILSSIIALFLIPLGFLLFLAGYAHPAHADDTSFYEGCNGGACDPNMTANISVDASGGSGSGGCACGSSSGGCGSNQSG